MSPKQKAFELMDKYITIITEVDNYSYLEEIDKIDYAKQCSLISINEIIYAVSKKDIKYWLDVKTEIENYEYPSCNNG